MSEDGKNIVKLMTEIRTLCKEISALLETADRIVERDNWSSINNRSSTVTEAVSKDLGKPFEWVPEFLFRFYTNKQSCPHILLYVAVILDNRKNDPAYTPKGKERFEEPILTAGYFDYGNEEVVEENVWKEAYCKGHFFSNDLCYDGKIWPVEPKEMKCFAKQEKDKNLVKFTLPLKLKSLALPLIDISDPNNLKERVIDPLLTDMITS